MTKKERETYMNICKYDKEPKEIIINLQNKIEKQLLELNKKNRQLKEKDSIIKEMKKRAYEIKKQKDLSRIVKEGVLERQIRIKNGYLELIRDIGYDYDGCNTTESLKELIDELVEYARKGIKNEVYTVEFIGARETEYNILHEKLN